MNLGVDLATNAKDFVEVATNLIGLLEKNLKV